MFLKIFEKKQVRWIVTGLHVLLTFIWFKKVFMNIGNNPSGLISLSNLISDKAEIIITYIVTELFAIALIYFLWDLVFKVITRFKKEYIIFIALFIVGAVFIAFMWPECIYWIGGSYDDNVITYACGVRLTPDYWHCIYHSVIYCASLLFFPIDFMIPLVQLGLFVYVVAYIYFRVKRVSGKKKWFVFGIFAIPTTLELICYGHRIMYYCIFALLYLTYIWFDIEENKKRTVAEDLKLAVFGSFLAVYRSEGIIIGVLLYGIYVIFQGKRKTKRILLEILAFALMFVCFKMPQKMGDIKYYGNDYSIINSFNRLQVIFNDPRAILDYNGADEDLKAIADVFPLEVICQYGVEGFRRYNTRVTGSVDLNQTQAGKKSSAYLSAYRNIQLHNLKIVSKIIENSVVYAATGRMKYYFDGYNGRDCGLAGWTYPAWDEGRKDFYGNRLTSAWNEMSSKTGLYTKVHEFHGKWVAFLKKYYILAGVLIALSIYSLFLFVKGLILSIKTKEKEHIGKGFISLSVLLLLAGTIVTMPDPLSYYFIISIYLMFALLYFSLCKKSKAL